MSEDAVTGGYATVARVKALEARMSELEANHNILAAAQVIESRNISELINRFLALEAWAKESNP